MQTANHLSENKPVLLLKFIGISCLPVVLWFVPIDTGNSSSTICIFKNITNKECYGCGMTRAVLSMLHCKFSQAYHFNKLIIVVFPAIVYLWVKHTYSYYKKCYCTNI